MPAEQLGTGAGLQPEAEDGQSDCQGIPIESKDILLDRLRQSDVELFGEDSCRLQQKDSGAHGWIENPRRCAGKWRQGAGGDHVSYRSWRIVDTAGASSLQRAGQDDSSGCGLARRPQGERCLVNSCEQRVGTARDSSQQVSRRGERLRFG